MTWLATLIGMLLGSLAVAAITYAVYFILHPSGSAPGGVGEHSGPPCPECGDPLPRVNHTGDVCFACYMRTLRGSERTGQCRGCGYPLRGSRSRHCPECGRPIESNRA